MVNQHLIVVNLGSVSINKILVTEFITAKVSQDLTSMQNMSTQRNQVLIRYVFSEIIECLEKNIRKQIRLQMTIENKTNEQSAKYPNRNIEIQSC